MEVTNKVTLISYFDNLFKIIIIAKAVHQTVEVI